MKNQIILFLCIMASIHLCAQCYEPHLKKADAAYARGNYKTAAAHYDSALCCPDSRSHDNGSRAKEGLYKCLPVLTVNGEKDIIVKVSSDAGKQSFDIKSLRLSSWSVISNTNNGLSVTPDVSDGKLTVSWNENTSTAPREWLITISGEGGFRPQCIDMRYDAVAKIQIIQANGCLTVNGRTHLERSFSWEGGVTRFDVGGIPSGLDYTISGIDASWMSVQKESDQFFLIVNTNESKIISRDKSITVSYNNQSATIHVTQSDCSNKEDLKAKARIDIGNLNVNPNSAIPFKKGNVSGFISHKGEIVFISSTLFYKNRFNLWKLSINNTENSGREHYVWSFGLYPINNNCFLKVEKSDDDIDNKNRTVTLYSVGKNGIHALKKYELNDKKHLGFHRFDNDDYAIFYDTNDYTNFPYNNREAHVKRCIELWNNNGSLIQKDYTDMDYEMSRFFSEDGIAIKYSIWTGKKIYWQWFVIKRDGTKIQLPKDVYDVYFIADGIIGFRKENSSSGYCNLDGTILIKPSYRFILPFSDGFAKVYDENSMRWYIIDTKGNVFNEGFSEVIPRIFSEGLAAVTTSNSGENSQKTICFIDKKGKTQFCIIGHIHDGCYSQDHNCLTYLFKNAIAVTEGEEGYSLIDKNGVKIVDSAFSQLTPMINGLAVARGKHSTSLINRKGEIYDIPRLEWPDISFNSDGTLTLFGKYYCMTIDSNGNYINGMNHKKINIGNTSFSPSIFSVNDIYGFFNDTLGIVTIQPQFNQAQPFSEELAAVKIGAKWGYIDKTGKIVIPTIFDSAGQFTGGRAKVVIDGKNYYIDKRFHIIDEL